jgi:hypothetical protein
MAAPGRHEPAAVMHPQGKVRAGTIIRSDAIRDLGAEGLAKLHTLQIRSAIDLRQSIERELDPSDIHGVSVKLTSESILDWTQEH